MEQKKYSPSRLAKMDNTVRTLDEVAEIMGLSRQRIHDIEQAAFRKLRQAFVRKLPRLQYVRNENGSVCGLRETEYTSLT